MTKPRCLVVMSVWGDWHTDMFLKLNLRTLLSPNNFPRFAKDLDTSFRIWTTPTDRQRLQADKLFRSLESHCPVSYEMLSQDQVNDAIGTHHIFWEEGLIQAAAQKAFVLFLPPDVAWAEGSLRHLSELAIQGKTAIFFNNHVRTNVAAVLPEFERIYTKDRSFVTIHSRKLTRMAVSNLHPLYTAFLRDSPNFPYHPEIIIWSVPGEGLLTCFTAHNPFFFRPDVHELNITRMLKSVPDPDKIHFVTDSDDFFMLSLAEPGKDRQWYEENTSLQTLSVMKWYSQYTSFSCDMMARKFGTIHFEDITQFKWKPVKNSANILVDQLVTGRELYHLWVILSQIGQQCAASLLGIVFFLRITRRFLSPKYRHVIIVPSEDLLSPIIHELTSAMLDLNHRNDVIRWLRMFVWPMRDFERRIRETEILLDDVSFPLVLEDGRTALIDLDPATYRLRAGDYNEIVMARSLTRGPSGKTELPDFIRGTLG